MKTWFRLAVITLSLLTFSAHAAKHGLGLKVPKDWQKSAKFDASFNATPLPDKFDWRDNGVPVPAVKSQGQCGSCWAHATAEVLEWQVAIADKKLEVLSPQELTSCDTTSSGCSGGFFTAFDYLVKPGLTYEKDFPYKAKNLRCIASQVPHDYKLVEWHYVGEQGRKPTVDEIRTAIYTTGPVAVDMYADNGFMNYHGGVYCGRSFQSNHMVVLVGWDLSKKAWIVQNSWNTAWGEKGYAHVRFGCNNIASITAYAVYRP